jgi:CheY-like chemotaxis protein
MTGLELASRIRAIRPDIPVILASGYSNSALEHDAKAMGVAEVLRKPLRQSDVALALARAFSRQNGSVAIRKSGRNEAI